MLYADPGLVSNATVDEHSLEIVTTVVSLTVELSSARAKLGIKPQDAPAKEAATQPAAPAPPPPPAVPVAASAFQQVEPPVKQPISAEPEPWQPAVAAPAVAEAQPAAYVPPPSTGDLSEADQKLHNDARKFARLLVSEIKLYNAEGSNGKARQEPV